MIVRIENHLHVITEYSYAKACNSVGLIEVAVLEVGKMFKYRIPSFLIVS